MKESGELHRDMRCITADIGQTISVVYKKCAGLPEQLWEYSQVKTILFYFIDKD